jgi:hypothetical protein
LEQPVGEGPDGSRRYSGVQVGETIAVAGAVLGSQPDSTGSRLRVCSAGGLEERKPFQAQ